MVGEITAAWPTSRWHDVGVVVGVSGGADSVCLARMLADLRTSVAPRSTAPTRPTGFLILAHFHHGLRGEAADQDQDFVRRLARSLGLDFATQAASQPRFDEANMRAARLQFLVETAKSAGARYIALAHSADDNAETVLHHLLRGTGPAGLAGISTTRPIDDDLVLVRPLIGSSRATIREALVEMGQDWREDESNANPDYQRNWIRRELIPLIESRYPKAVPAIARAASTQRQWAGVIDAAAQDWLDQHATWTDDGVSLRRNRGGDRPVVVAALQAAWQRLGWPQGAMSHAHWTRLADAICGDDGNDANAACPVADAAFSLPGLIQVRADVDRVGISGGNTSRKTSR